MNRHGWLQVAYWQLRIIITPLWCRLLCKILRQQSALVMVVAGPQHLGTFHLRTHSMRNNAQMKEKCSERRKHCALAVPRRTQKFPPPATDPFPGVRDGQNLISWRWSLPLPIDPVW